MLINNSNYFLSEITLNSDEENNDDFKNKFSSIVLEEKPKLKKPPLYKVIMLNDDYTPMEFVVEIIEEFFYKTRDVATRIMLKVHTEGKGICGVFTQDVAETKAALVNQHAQDSKHPLMCQVEPIEDNEED